jgi:hypothetical protein
VVSEGISNLDQSLDMVITLLNLIPVIVALLVLIVFVRPIVRAGS